MPVNVGINGFGRMGRLALRAAFENRPFRSRISTRSKADPRPPPIYSNSIASTADGKRQSRPRLTSSSSKASISVTAISRTFTTLHGRTAGIDLVLECSGKLLTLEALQPYLDQGICKVIVAAPVKKGALNIVMGVNDHLYDPRQHHIVTAASCTTNCLRRW